MVPKDTQLEELAESFQECIRVKDSQAANDTFYLIQEKSYKRTLGFVANVLGVREGKRCHEDAEDVTGEVYLNLYNYLVEGEPIRNVTALLSRFAKLRAIDFLRSKYAKHESTVADDFWLRHNDTYEDHSESPYDAIDDRDFAEKVAPVLLNELPPIERDVLWLRYVEELSVAETAARLAITPDRVKKRLQTAVKRAKEIVLEREGQS